MAKSNAYVLFAVDAPPMTKVKSDGAKPRYRKDIIHTGTFTHPKDGWTLKVTPERMDTWVASFRKMRDNGRGVDIVKDHSFKADDKIGEIVDMQREGDRLYAIHEFADEDAAKLAERVGTVSPWIDPDYRDGRNEYGEAILHSAIVQQPVIDSQEKFQAMAASLLKHDASALLESKNGAYKMDLTTIRSLLGAGQEVTEENAAELVKQRLEKAESDKTEASQAAKDAQAKAQQLESQLSKLQAKADGGKPEPDADVLEMQAEGIETQFDNLVEAGKLQPAIAASLKSLFVGDKGSRNAYALSAVYSGRGTALAKDVVNILKDIKPVTMGEATKGQTMALSFADMEADDRKKANEQARELLAAGAGKTQK